MARNEEKNMGIDGDVAGDIIQCEASEIFVPEGRFRPLNKAKAKKLSESIEANGRQLQPILIDRNGNLIDGNHRLEACRILGIKVQCIVVDEYNTDKLSLMEIDTNLIRNDLSQTETENHLAERKRLYNILFPDTAKRGAKGSDASGQKSFAEDTAEVMGVSTRTVERAVKRGEEACSAIQEARDNKEISTSDVDAILKDAGTDEEAQTDKLKAIIQAKAEKKDKPKVEPKESSTQTQMNEQADKLEELIKQANELQLSNQDMKAKYEKKAQALKKANETIKNLKDRIKRAKESNPELKI